ncbi:MAG: ABC transporter permease, partial [bacterium]
IFPDFEHYGLLWVGRTSLASAYDMKSAFNNVVLTLSDEARLKDVIDQLDVFLEPYGGHGADGRKDQTSHRYLSEEFRQLSQLATMLPVIFLGVAAFLLNIVMNRLISTQRDEIATLKAFGYRNLEIGLHYLKLVMAIVLLGVTGGVAVGIWMGKKLGDLYMQFYRFPFLEYTLRPEVAINAALVTTAAAVAGTLFAAWRAALLPPAEAMRPEPPARYRETLLERLGLQRFFSQPTRIIIRQIERRPIRALLSVIGIAMACAIVILGTFTRGAVDFMVNVQFGLSQREDMAVTFVEPASRRALYDLKSLPGVKYGEVFRSVPARIRFQHRSYPLSIQGVESGGDLYRLLDTDLEPIEPPPEGIVLTDYLGQILGIRPGDFVTVEVLEGRRPVRRVPVVALVKQYIGISGYMELSALNRFMREGHLISGAYLAADSRYQPDIYLALKNMPRVAGTAIRKQSIANFYETMGEQVFIFTFFITIFATAIAFGVVYNNARIALSERSRELGSLRVLGLTRGEVSYILLGELGMLTLAAIPIGFLIGRGLCRYLIHYFQSDLFRIPLIIEPGSYALAATVVLVSALISGLIVRYRLDRLDLIGVLKTRE